MLNKQIELGVLIYIYNVDSLNCPFTSHPAPRPGGFINAPCSTVPQVRCLVLACFIHGGYRFLRLAVSISPDMPFNPLSPAFH